MPDRPKLHHQIRNEFTRTIAEFFRANPDELRNPHLERDLGFMHGLMMRVLRVVDQYEVQEREDAGE
jgi:hypothetical protein